MLKVLLLVGALRSVAAEVEGREDRCWDERLEYKALAIVGESQAVSCDEEETEADIGKNHTDILTTGRERGLVS